MKKKKTGNAWWRNETWRPKRTWKLRETWKPNGTWKPNEVRSPSETSKVPKRPPTSAYSWQPLSGGRSWQSNATTGPALQRTGCPRCRGAPLLCCSAFAGMLLFGWHRSCCLSLPSNVEPYLPQRRRFHSQSAPRGKPNQGAKNRNFNSSRSSKARHDRCILDATIRLQRPAKGTRKLGHKGK